MENLENPFYNWGEQFNSPLLQDSPFGEQMLGQPNGDINNAYVSPIGNETIFQDEPSFVEFIDFELLLKDIWMNSGRAFDYDYRKYESKWSIPEKGGLPNALDDITHFIEKIEEETGLNQFPILGLSPRQVSKPFINDQNERIYFSGKLNTKSGPIIIDRKHIGFSFNIDESKKMPIFRDYFLYQENEQDKSGGNVAFIIEANTYENYSELCRAEGLDLSAMAKNKIIQVYSDALKKAEGKPDKLDWLYLRMPDFVLNARDKNLVINDLASLLLADVDETGSDFINEEQLVLRLLRLFLTGKIEDHDLVLSVLCTKKVDGKILMEVLWRRMDDFGGTDNFTAAIKTIYELWLFSSYADPQYKDYKYNGQPETIAYQSKKILGFYTDNYKFRFQDNQIVCSKDKVVYVAGPEYTTAIVPVIVGIYHIFQPLRMPEINQEGEISFPDLIIPAFYLKAFQDKNAASNFEKDAWLAFDVITTLVAVGNLMKLRYLTYLTKVQKSFLILNNSVQVVSAASNLMLNLVNNCTGGTFCQKLRSYLFWLDMATLSVDAITSKMLRKTAEELMEVIPDQIKKTHPELTAHLDEVSISGRGRKLGQRITNKELFRVEHFLKELKCELELAPEFGNYQVAEYFDKFGEPVIFNETAKAAFITNGNTMKMVLREEATIYELFHELMHLRHSKLLGLKNYYGLGKSPDGRLIKEQYVFDKIIEYRNYFTKSELEHAWGYLNNINESFGKSPTLLPFDIDQIPQVRKEVNIQELFKLK